ncbi:MAG: hypothetical protein JWQ66_102, partial [Mucilaginibacter sp.]|nr:hypothetical protein [Mucilaginibacter sp.]
MKFKAYFTLFLIIASLSLSAQNSRSSSDASSTSEQFTIAGKVLNQKDKKPIADANVFINNTTIGTRTDNAGDFTLNDIKPGKYKLVISIVGFENYSREVLVNNNNINLPSITISPKTIALKEVSIKSKNNGKLYFNWFYEAFKNEFLGTSEQAKDCKILNPEALYIDYDEVTSTVTATSSGFLEIENKDLGYNIKYLLTDFRLINKDPKAKEVRYEGSVLFTKMKGTPGQERRWEQRRQDAYEGSSMHFLRAALNDQLDVEDFRVLRLINYINLDRPADSLIQAKIKRFNSAHADEKYFLNVDSLDYWKKKLKLPKVIKTLVPYALNKADIISPTDQSGIFALGCDSDKLLIDYDKNSKFLSAAQLNNINSLNYNLNRPDNR